MNAPMLIAKAVAMFAINISIAVAWLWQLERDRHFEPWETVAALYQMPRGSTHVDYLFVGSSHMGAFRSCPHNVTAVKAAFGEDIAFATKLGSGVLQHRLLLTEFYRRRNTADTVVLFVDPFTFYSPFWNETMPFIEAEPVDLTFLLDLALADVQLKRLYFYVRSKFSWHWCTLQRTGFKQVRCTQSVRERRQLTEYARRQFYPNGTDTDLLARYMRELERLIEAVETNGSKLILVDPPTLFDTLPDVDNFHREMIKIAERHDVLFADLSGSIQDTCRYRNHDHLNDKGVQYFVQNFASLLDQATATPG